MIGEVDVCTPYSLFSLSIILRRAVNAGRNQTMPNNTQLLTNAEIADRLSTLAQLLSTEKANPYKIKAYRRAANTIRGLGESVVRFGNRNHLSEMQTFWPYGMP
jgi:hypothetical protein